MKDREAIVTTLKEKLNTPLNPVDVLRLFPVMAELNIMLSMKTEETDDPLALFNESFLKSRDSMKIFESLLGMVFQAILENNSVLDPRDVLTILDDIDTDREELSKHLLVAIASLFHIVFDLQDSDFLHILSKIREDLSDDGFLDSALVFRQSSVH